MADDKEYNGWTNYMTWVVNLHLTNEQGTDEELRRIANSKKEYEHYKEDELKEFVDEIVGEETGLKGDLIGGALSEVNWREIIESNKEEKSRKKLKRVL